MTRFARIAALLATALLAQALWLVPAVAAHPLGNATVSRALSVRVAVESIAVRVTIDMAEIPAFTAIQAIDRDGNGGADAGEAAAWAPTACDSWTSGVSASIDAVDLTLRPDAPPELTFPPGVGGLETLRLVCPLSADVPDGLGEGRRLEVADRSDDGRPGWREVTITPGGGVRIVESDVPTISPSRELTSYPEDRLAAPLDVRAGVAILVLGDRGAAPPPAPGAGPASAPADDAFVTLLSGAGRAHGLGALLALLLSMGLGAAHALTPGHGKALVAASLIGARGTPRQAIGLGLTVAASHTIGVLVLGAVVLGAGQALAPDRLLAWLSLIAGACVVIVGASLAMRALRDRRVAHDHGHPHPHAHPHPHPHPHMGAGMQKRGIIALGLFGGLVPSTSAVIVLLLAATTGQLVLGLTLILAFGLGMAIVLASLALGSAVMAGRVLEAGALASRPLVARIGRSVPLVSGLAVLVAGAAMTVGAISQVL